MQAGCRRPSLLLVRGLGVPIRGVVGLSNDPGRADREVLRASLVGLRVVASLRRHYEAAGSHPEGEPPAGSIDPFSQVVGQLVAAAPLVVVGLLVPTGLRHPPCRLLLRWLLL